MYAWSYLIEPLRLCLKPARKLSLVRRAAGKLLANCSRRPGRRRQSCAVPAAVRTLRNCSVPTSWTLPTSPNVTPGPQAHRSPTNMPASAVTTMQWVSKPEKCRNYAGCRTANKDIATATRSWPVSCSTLTSYHRCCHHNERWVLSTDCDGCIVFTTTPAVLTP